jgi:phosphoesterase RecJ-like protein
VIRPASGQTASAAEVAERLKSESRILVISHESPDGDALGCVSAMLGMADSLGVAATGYIPGLSALPDEYSFLPRLNEIRRGDLPAVEPGTTVYILDCGSSTRFTGSEAMTGLVTVNIDHHHDNSGYGDFNLLDPVAPSTTTIVYDIFRARALPVDSSVATALYVGLVTDTGRFQYSNTTPRAHRMAADLQEQGVSVSEVYRSVYESTPLPKLMLLQRALCHLDVRLGGSLVTSWLGPDDFVQAGADGGHAEGIIDMLRRIQGVRVAALVKQLGQERPGECKVSLRSTDGTVDVAAIARLKDGGGHVRAAGFTCAGSLDEILDWIEDRAKSSL